MLLILNHQIICDIFLILVILSVRSLPAGQAGISYEELKWLIEILYFVQNDQIRKEIS